MAAFRAVRSCRGFAPRQLERLLCVGVPTCPPPLPMHACMQICDHVQYARALAHAYPFIYDVQEIIRAVYELAVEASAAAGSAPAPGQPAPHVVGAAVQ